MTATVHLVAHTKAHHAGLFRNQALHLGVHLFALGPIEFNPGLHHELVHPVVPEVRVVPGTTAQKLGRDLQVGRGPVSPEHRAKGHLHPDVVPVAVPGHPLDVQIHTRLGQRLLEHHARVDGSGVATVGHLHFNGAAEARFLEMKTGLVRVESLGFEVGVVELVGRTHRLVIAQGRVTGKHVVDHLLAVNAVFQAQHHIPALERVDIQQCDKAVAISRALGARDLDSLVLGQQ